MMQETTLMMNKDVSPFLLYSQIFNNMQAVQTTSTDDNRFDNSKSITQPQQL
jgi:hypothetical protein